MESMSVISQSIKKLREDSSFTQEQIAQYLDMDLSLLSSIEDGTETISVNNLEKLGCLFGIKIEDFSNAQLNSGKLSISSSSLTKEDLSTIASINKIAMNLNMMHELLNEDSSE